MDLVVDGLLWTGRAADKLAMLHIWCVSIWVILRNVPIRPLAPIGWIIGINAMALASSLLISAMVIAIPLEYTDDPEYELYSIWNRALGPYAWSFWLHAVPVLAGLLLLLPKSLGSWRMGMTVAVIASMVPLLRIAMDRALEPHSPSCWTLRYDMSTSTVLREITLTLALLLVVARQIWPLANRPAG